MVRMKANRIQHVLLGRTQHICPTEQKNICNLALNQDLCINSDYITKMDYSLPRLYDYYFPRNHAVVVNIIVCDSTVQRLGKANHYGYVFSLEMSSKP